MMRPARMMVPVFASSDPKHIEFSRDAIRAGVTGLMLENMVWLRYYPNTPPLYNAGVYYKPEKADPKTGEYGEDWQTIPFVMHKGFGDCEDLAAWRSAELRNAGIKATPFIKVRQLPSGPWRAHAVVKLPDGTIEDPSAKLGMYAYSADVSR